MANTTNLDLVKPAGTEHALISVLNSNSDKIDAFAGTTNTAISAVQNGLAYIVGNTNTTGSTLAVGQFVYVKGHSTIAEGLRKVTASISANGSITTSNTAACSEGGLNALNSNKLDKTWNAVSGTSTKADGSDARIYPTGMTEIFIVEGTTYNECLYIPIYAIPSGDSYWYTKKDSFHINKTNRKVWCYDKNGSTTGMVVTLYYR
jgi:hypothetical protein